MKKETKVAVRPVSEEAMAKARESFNTIVFALPRATRMLVAPHVERVRAVIGDDGQRLDVDRRRSPEAAAPARKPRY